MAVALVTGGTRGIGRASAVALARKGFDVAVTGRTVHEGDGRDDGDAAKGGRAIPGSLDSTVAQLEAVGGGRVLPLQLDLTDPGAAEAAVRAVNVGLGPIDVLVNNAVSHHGNNIHVAELTPAVVQENLLANAAQPLSLIALVLPGMVERGSGCIVNLLSGAGMRDPGAPALQGGWGVLYGMHKAAMNRIAGVVAVEAGASGVLCFGLNPGFVKTAVVGALPGFDKIEGTPEEVPGEVVAWLATSPDAAAYNGQGVDALEIAGKHGVTPG